MKKQTSDILSGVLGFYNPAHPIRPFRKEPYEQREQEKYGIEELLTKLRNASSDIILEWLAGIPMIDLSEYHSLLFVYSPTIMLVVTDPDRCLCLAFELRQANEHFVAVPGFGDPEQLSAAPKDTLTFHDSIGLKKYSLAVVSGQLDQLWNLLRLFN